METKLDDKLDDKEVDDRLVRKEVLRDKIAKVLREWILNGTLKPGDRIVEYVLARRLRVSPTPLREALWLLSREGLVEIHTHRGAVVTRLSDRDIREIFTIRELLETHAAKMIRATLTPVKQRRLEAAARELDEAARARDIASFSAADHAFHETLWELSENRHLPEILREISSRFFSYELMRDLPHGKQFRFDAMADEHRALVEVILTGTDEEIEAGFRKAFAVFLTYVLERFGEGAPAV
jgi:DNA-binding GntR family transcriptional regulator